MLTLIACLFVLAMNVAVLGLNLKLYTEILKDARFNARAKGRLPEETPDA